MSDNLTDSLKRHWHGITGDRYEHHNVWTHGGAKGPATRAPWALTPEMMAAEANRRGSSGSNSSTTSANSNSNASPTTPTVNDRRRSSASSKSGPMFAGLHSVKRDSVDSNMAARRASYAEQREQGGFLSKMWDGYIRGK